jgi:hypothetical protein
LLVLIDRQNHRDRLAVAGDDFGSAPRGFHDSMITKSRPRERVELISLDAFGAIPQVDESDRAKLLALSPLFPST